MKKLYPYFCLVFVLALVVPAYAGNGNGAPSGPHYNLNIIGVPKEKSADMNDNSGHRIFVKLEGNTKIMLGMGEFKVLDANGTDGTAVFQLPGPESENPGETTYSVFVRALGKPDGSARMTTCLEDPNDGDPICSTHVLEMVTRGKGNKFENVSKELLYIYADVDGDGIPERHPLFSDALQDYFWNYDNNGLKLAQFRFYHVSTVVPDP